MTQTPTPDIPRLRKAVEWVEAEATKPRPQDRQWYQSNYFIRRPELTCGTAYCVAGMIALEDGWTPEWKEFATATLVTKDGFTDSVHNVAKAALGLTDTQAFSLFAGTNRAEDVRAVAERIAGERL